MMVFVRRFPKYLFYIVFALAMLVCAAVLSLRYWLLPNIENYRDFIAASMSQAAGTRVAIGGIRAEWDGLRPRLELDRVQMFDSKDNPALELVKVDLTLSWGRSILSQALRLYSLEITQPSLEIKRDKAGKLFVAGIPISEDGGEGGLGDMVLRTRSLYIRDAVVSWEDELRGAPPLVLDGVSLHLENRGQRHRFGLVAKPPAQLAGSIDLRGDLLGLHFADKQNWSGELYAELPYADGGSWRSYIPLPKSFRGGRGAIRLWLDFQHQTVRSFVADVKLSNTVARLDDNLPELDLASLDGRIRYRAIGGGFEVSSENLSLVTRGETRTGSTDFLFRTEPKKDGKEGQGEFRANRLELAAWASLTEYLPLDKSLKEKITQFAPTGRVDDLVFKWIGEPDAPTTYSLIGQIKRGAINPVGSYPGFIGLAGHIDANEKGGKLSIESATRLNVPHFFNEPLSPDNFIAHAKWKRGEGYTDITLEELAFADSHMAGTASGTYRAIEGKPGVIDLSARFSRLDGHYTALYLPSMVNAHAREWIDRGIVAAKASDGNLRVVGDLAHFPFADDKNGQFLFNIKLTDGILDFNEAWPRIENINAEVIMHGHKLEVRAKDAEILGNKLKNVAVGIDDYFSHKLVLDVTGEAIGPVADKIRFINQSPVKAMLGGFTDDIIAGGNGSLALKLSIPLDDTHLTRINGDYQFQRASAVFGPHSPPFTEINGHLLFTENGVRAQDLSAQLLGGPVWLNVASRPDGAVRVNAKGNATTEGLQGFLGYPILKKLSGRSEWQGQLTGRKDDVSLIVNSSLGGVAIDLPAPLGKSEQQEMPLSFEQRWGGGKHEWIRTSLGGFTFGEFEYAASSGTEPLTLKRGVVSFGKPALLPQDGLWLMGSLRELDVDRWREVLREPGGKGGLPIAGVDLTVQSVHIFDRLFADVHLAGHADGERWLGSIAAQDVAGDFIWYPTGKGLLYARLKKLIIPDEHSLQAAQAESGEEIDFPALDIAADALQFKNKKLGMFELKAEQQGRDWRIERLHLKQAGATLDANGLWSRNVKPTTTLKLKLDAPDVGKLLNELGFVNSVRNGVAALSGELSWPGAPYEMLPSKLSGNLRLEAKAGQFLKIEPGAGRLLGLMSLQSLPRRITLDFRDIFSEGFSFDVINGNTKIRDGILHTEDFNISGPAAKVEMSGDVNLGQETQSLNVIVIPTLGEGVSIATGLLGGPVLGVTTFILQKVLKDPINRAVAYEYRVTGTWDNPNVVKVERNPSGDAEKVR